MVGPLAVQRLPLSKVQDAKIPIAGTCTNAPLEGVTHKSIVWLVLSKVGIALCDTIVSRYFNYHSPAHTTYMKLLKGRDSVAILCVIVFDIMDIESEIWHPYAIMYYNGRKLAHAQLGYESSVATHWEILKATLHWIHTGRPNCVIWSLTGLNTLIIQAQTDTPKFIWCEIKDGNMPCLIFQICCWIHIKEDRNGGWV